MSAYTAPSASAAQRKVRKMETKKTAEWPNDALETISMFSIIAHQAQQKWRSQTDTIHFFRTTLEEIAFDNNSEKKMRKMAREAIEKYAIDRGLIKT